MAGASPVHWRDQNGTPKCIAAGCTSLFINNQNFSNRRDHWRTTGCAFRTKFEHDILICMEDQTRCVSCNFHNHNGYTMTLYQHEVSIHGTTVMSSIEGYVTLVRSGQVVSEDAQKAIFSRMMNIIVESNMLGPLSRYSNIRDRAEGQNEPKLLGFEDLKTQLSPPGRRPNGPQAPYYEPFGPNEFLLHLIPSANNQYYAEWTPFWYSMRNDHAAGRL